MPVETLLISLFVSSPSDVGEELKVLEEVVKELNHGIGRQINVMIEIKSWKTDVYPGMGRAQALINEQIGEYDIFLGIMWKRFGTPTGVAESGTEEEFNRAYALWESRRNLHILFYFCLAPVTFPNNAEEIEQLGKVQKFREKLKSMGLVIDYETHSAFANVVRPQLTNLLYDIQKQYRKRLGADETDQEPQSAPARLSRTHAIHTLLPHSFDSLKIQTRQETLYSSFLPHKHQFMRIKAVTTPGYVQNKWCESSVFLIRDPLRPYLIQIGETRAQRKFGNPEVIPELSNLDLPAFLQMYPFISSQNFKWIRMVIAELSTNPEVLDYIHRNDPDQEVRVVAAKNPSGSVALLSKACLFCDPNFKFDRRIKDGVAESEHSMIIRNDFPYGPYFHYIVFPTESVHSWEDLQADHLSDMNLLLHDFLCNRRNAADAKNHQKENIDGAPGVHIGFNSTIRHLVLTRTARASAGASIAHVHKQAWGMTEGTLCLSNHLTKLCRHFEKEDIDYLDSYLSLLRSTGCVVWEDRLVALFVPLGQTSVHELQAIVKRKGAGHYLSLSREEVSSLSFAEFIAIQIYRELGINSFNELMLSENLHDKTRSFRLVIAFITREVDLAVSELNLMYVVDKHPHDTVAAISNFIGQLEKSIGFVREPSFGCSPVPA